MLVISEDDECFELRGTRGTVNAQMVASNAVSKIVLKLQSI